MELRDLDLPPDIVSHFQREGVESLYPPQEAAVEAGITAGENLVAAVPTASGKTLIAQLAMLSSPGTALYIVPLRALATEKHEAFAALPGVSVAIATGDVETSPEGLGEHDVVVATSEKVDSLIRHGAPWLSDLSCVVVDEVHLLDSRDRGPTLEVTVAKLRALLPDVQVVALSATVANPGAIAGWLDAGLVETDWRPVSLRRGISHDGEIAFEDGSTHAIEAGEGEATPALVRDVLSAGGQCLVFVHSRRATEELAARLGTEWFGTGRDVADEIEATARTATGERLADCVRDGVAFHHAGLRPEHRSFVEGAFGNRDLDVICATPTLAAGVNIPARRVVVRDWRRFTDEGREPLPVLEVHQMFGRAGRPHLDPYGEAVLVADSAEEADELRVRYLEGEPEAVSSKLARQDALRTHVLATVASGFADSRAELLDVLSGTFYAAEEDRAVLVDIADLVVDYLESVDMLRAGDGLAATELGAQVSRLYVDPRTAAELLSDLRVAETLPGRSRLTALELVCDTPDMTSSYLRGDDWAAAQRFAERHRDAFTTSIDDFDGAYDAWLSSLKTVRVLSDWIDGDPEDEITDRHGIGPGDLRMATERAVWLLSAAESLAELRDLDVVGLLRETREAIEDRRET